MAHIITGVIGSGVLSLAWSVAQLGWIAGPLTMLIFASITFVSAFSLCNCYRSPDPLSGPTRNTSYLAAVGMILGEALHSLKRLSSQPILGKRSLLACQIFRSNSNLYLLQESSLSPQFPLAKLAQKELTAI